ncbi:hypothetical protein M409DRAFT_30932 [Zasmidium cellare ATCC 36951]|uniref:SnoaL-like domain-containing protein n=1 Tax=Zasmidium cellare ATCC 36951 TaxID=1080233 RepID=A0A6A6BUU8_ZASCE|nr:uncharacterized protein M409DRAFT_30932 [Zasmidium cellare ATCC 36951]KAF2158564.1 hypothetical protein M409DRAFT_30932 [Zasmidium cellare ATCC 36951]
MPTSKPNESEALSTEEQLKLWSIDIIRSVNARNPRAILEKYAASDYVYEKTEDSGQVLHLDAEGMLQIREFYLQRLSPQASAEVLSTEVQVDWDKGRALVWVGMLVRNDAKGVMRERMNIHS